MELDRRQILAGTIGLLAAGQAWSGQAPSADQSPAKTRIILLGTKGGPPLSRSGRTNIATVLLINDQAYVVDCGHGVTRQLISAGVGLGQIRHVFITHLHSDHTLEYGALLYNAWLTPRPPLIAAHGPKGLAAMTRAFMAYQGADIDIRVADEGMTDLRQRVTTHEIAAPGLVLRNDDVTVTCCRVPHPPVPDAFAYRFDTKDRSVVFSGDTAYSPDLARFAAGADVLIHEVLYVPAVDAIVRRATNATRLREHILAAHTSTEDVGRIAAQAGVKTLVLSHLIPGDEALSDALWLEGVRKHFSGRVIIGTDLAEI